MKLRLIALLLLSGIVGFALGVGIKFVYEATAFKPYTWDNKAPIIVNCYGEDFSEAQFVRAVHYWTIRGHNIGFYEHNPPASICEREGYIEGFIVLRKADRGELSSPTLAVTKRWTSFDKLKGAVIKYRPGTQNLAWINEHELGHALGYAHVEEDGHIMHLLQHKMAGKFWIP